ncbi:MAG: glycoside hydrolase family 15 protein [Nitrospiraceae bacterium]
MASRIEDYALIGDTHTAALVGRDGSIDWYCAPRFDSAACFAALLGTKDNGRWLLAPKDEVQGVRRRYREGTLILETEYRTEGGTAIVIDWMPPHDTNIDLIRSVVGIKGQVRMTMELIIRFDYGWVVPWVRRRDGLLEALAGPDALDLRTDVKLEGKGFATVAEFTVTEGQEVPFVLTWRPSHGQPPEPIDVRRALAETEIWWRNWSDRCTYQGPWREAVLRSLITLKALTYAPTGGIVAAVTTSLPEWIGGVRNWDYRYCWVRDATFTLYALLLAGYHEEALAWREWLLRATAGNPSELQIMYGLSGERRLLEYNLDWLPGYEGSVPVRVGNAASKQFQLDVYGEIMDAAHIGRRSGIEPHEIGWAFQQHLMEFLESAWERPDEGIWEVRGPRRHFTHSKVMAWVGVDRGIKAIERFGRSGPADRWKALRHRIHEQVCCEGYDSAHGAFMQYYGAQQVDASALMIPLVGFLPATDPRVIGTVKKIEQDLVDHGFVKRYEPQPSVDGLPLGEGAFLTCTFWLADNLALMGQQERACEVFNRLLDIRNDVGLLAEEYDPASRRQLGNFPQALSHISLINTAYNLTRCAKKPAEDRPSADLPIQQHLRAE